MNKRMRQKHMLLRPRKDGTFYPSRLLIRRASHRQSTYEAEHARILAHIGGMSQEELIRWIHTELLGE